MKKTMMLSMILTMIFPFVVSCNSATESESDKSSMLVGMLTDAGTIDDKSFNQGAWEGILKAKSELYINPKYLKPAGTTISDYMKEISNLYDARYRFIVTPGFKFERAIFKAQTKYPDAKFVLIDGSPHPGNYEISVNSNAVSVLFAEHESGFLAGVATSLELKAGDVGFIGGMEIPSVQKYNWGFQQGIRYANKYLGTQMRIKTENIIYQGSFDQVAAGGQLTAQMFDRGVKVIFCAAGGVGVGAINEAKKRAKLGELAWIVGVDVDQYADGIYQDEQSVILTSAMKRVDQAAYHMIQLEREGQFPGGQTLMMDTLNNGVGIPDHNPNLSEDTQGRINEVRELIKSGVIQISSEQGLMLN
jgi:basic membrane protein A